jgi:hypothetical protein
LEATLNKFEAAASLGKAVAEARIDFFMFFPNLTKSA